ncbi:DUF397 domain-containing protein, partial [Thermobifida halotolerans]
MLGLRDVLVRSHELADVEVPLPPASAEAQRRTEVIKTKGWRKSSYSVGESNCVEVAETPSAVLVRDTQHRDLGHLGFAPAE